jgi:uncharacterized protein (DUF2141 family)
MLIRKLLAAGLLTIVSTLVFSQSRINVHINNFANNKGSCLVCLYNSAEDFSDKGTPLQCTTVTIANKTTTTQFENIFAGDYAILVIHDANNNRKFDTNFLGIPKEGYGASKNKLPFAAAPKFDENKFTLTDGVTKECIIKLRYIF